MENEKFIRIKIIKSSSPTLWYKDHIDMEFNVVESFKNSVKISPKNNFQKYINYYVLKDDFMVIGYSKGRKKRYIYRWENEHKKIKHELSGYKINTNKSREDRPWNYLKRTTLLREDTYG
jgi:hypothetical protein